MFFSFHANWTFVTCSKAVFGKSALENKHFAVIESQVGHGSILISVLDGIKHLLKVLFTSAGIHPMVILSTFIYGGSNQFQHFQGTTMLWYDAKQQLLLHNCANYNWCFIRYNNIVVWRHSVARPILLK